MPLTCCEELIAKTWWEWTPPFNAAPVAQKDEKRTRHACFELRLICLKLILEWKKTFCRLNTALSAERCKPLESFDQELLVTGLLLWISSSRLSLNVAHFNEKPGIGEMVAHSLWLENLRLRRCDCPSRTRGMVELQIFPPKERWLQIASQDT